MATNEAELASIEEKVTRLATWIADFDGEAEQARKISRQMVFLERRLTLLPEVAELRARATAASSQLEVLKLRYAALDEAFGEWEAAHPVEAVPPRGDNVSRKHVPVAKWGILFSGEESDLSLGAFLERVDELCVARNVTKACLWSEAVDLFGGAALVWFRSVRRRIQSWEELVDELRKQFQPSDYDDRLLTEIRSRTQGESEPLGLYLAAIDNLFSRLSFEADEADKLEIVKKNILPYLMEKLCLHSLDSIDRIRMLGRRVEESRERASRFRPPPPARLSLEPDLAFRGSAKHKVRVDEAIATQPTSTIQDSNLACWNCQAVGHRYRECPTPRGRDPFCFGCGRRNTTATHCPTAKCRKKAGNAQGPHVTGAASGKVQ